MCMKYMEGSAWRVVGMPVLHPSGLGWVGEATLICFILTHANTQKRGGVLNKIIGRLMALVRSASQLMIGGEDKLET